MAQVLFKDKIGQLTENAGTISLAPSTLTIGGQQYQTSTLNVAGDFSVASSRYQVYAVLSGGVPTLVVSQNENSQGPSGHNTWKLVGSYYTSIDSTFLHFVDISQSAFHKIQEVFDMTGRGDFTGGEFKITRSGEILHAHVVTQLTFPSDSTPSSGTFIPDWADPEGVTQNTTSNATSTVNFFQIQPGGYLLTVRNYSGSGVASTVINEGAAITYEKSVSDSRAIKEL